MILIAFALLALVIAGWAGWCFPRATAWEWVDTTYYFLAICGAVLLYFAGVDFRNVQSLTVQQEEIEAQLEDLEDERPHVDMSLASESIVRSGGEFLQFIPSMAQTCEDPLVVNPACSVVEEMEPIVAPGIPLLLSYNEPSDLHGICNVANAVFQEFYDAGNFILADIAERYRDGLARGFTGLEYDSVQSHIDTLQPELEREAQDMLRRIEVKDDMQEWMSGLYQNEIRYGILTLRAFEACLRAPESLRDGQYSAWDETYRQVQDQQGEVRRQRDRAQAEALTPNVAARLRNSWWLFVIVFALSLKFGKSIAHLRKKSLIGS